MGFDGMEVGSDKSSRPVALGAAWRHEPNDTVYGARCSNRGDVGRGAGKRELLGFFALGEVVSAHCSSVSTNGELRSSGRDLRLTTLHYGIVPLEFTGR